MFDEDNRLGRIIVSKLIYRHTGGRGKPSARLEKTLENDQPGAARVEVFVAWIAAGFARKSNITSRIDKRIQRTIMPPIFLIHQPWMHADNIIRHDHYTTDGVYIAASRRNFRYENAYIFMRIEMEDKMTNEEKRVPWLLWPFWAIWRLVAFIIEMVGRLVGLILGAVFILVGIIVSLTVVGAVIGIPLVLFGALLMVRCLF